MHLITTIKIWLMAGNHNRYKIISKWYNERGRDDVTMRGVGMNPADLSGMSVNAFSEDHQEYICGL